jgi:hypothetical protein
LNDKNINKNDTKRIFKKSFLNAKNAKMLQRMQSYNS